MKRALRNLLVVGGMVVVGAACFAFGDYYDYFFGHSTRSSWKVIENDSWSAFAERACEGAVIGVFLGVIVVFGTSRKEEGSEGVEEDGADKRYLN